MYTQVFTSSRPLRPASLWLVALGATALIVGFGIFATTARAQGSATFLSFDVPGAKFTSPESINSKGEISGWWSIVDYFDQPQGFVRDKCGVITVFNVPGAKETFDQFPQSINSHGDSVGGWFGTSPWPQPYLRRWDGTITSSLVPFATTSTAESINDREEILGTYSAPDGTAGGFVRDAHGRLQPFNVAGATGLSPQSINNRGVSVGSWSQGPDPTVFHGFIRDQAGAIKSFDVAGAVATYPGSINDKGQITGSWNARSSPMQGFVRNPDGSVTTFAVSGAGITYAQSINNRGEIVGYWFDAQTNFHGFVREPGGEIIPFDAPGAVSTGAASINDEGEIAGFYYDSANVLHGFIRIPSGREDARSDCSRHP
jgi:hypothetical protein